MSDDKHELNALKERVKALEDELKTLSEEELEQVAGASTTKYVTPKYLGKLPGMFNGSISTQPKC